MSSLRTWKLAKGAEDAAAAALVVIQLMMAMLAALELFFAPLPDYQAVTAYGVLGAFARLVQRKPPEVL